MRKRFSSTECQRSDWGKHKSNCSSTKTPDSVDGGMNQATKVDKKFNTIEKATESKCKTTNCKFRESDQDPDTNVVCIPKDSQANLPQDAKGLSSHAIDASSIKDNTLIVKQKTETNDVTELIENEKSHDSNALKQDSSTSCYELENTSMPNVQTSSQDNVSKVVVYIKHAKEKHKLEIDLPCTGLQALKHFSRVVHVPLERLKIIHKGKLQTELSIVDRLKPSSVFLAFGETAESEEGLEAADIDLIMKQLSVERNVAIRALRKTNCLIDAIFEIGNDM